jgi:thiamine pyrophosphate-dependent acetolactate synthase large subunit-like protein
VTAATTKKVERKEILLRLAEFLDPKDILVAALAGTTNECFHTIHRPANLYMVGMGMVTPVAFGLAKALPKRRVIALDADGSMLLSPSILPVVGTYQPRNLCVVGFDNEQLYGSRGGPKSQTAHGADLAGIAKAAGISSTATVHNAQEFAACYSEFISHGGPAVIICKVEPLYTRAEGPNFNGQENKFRLVRLIEEWEGLTILEPSN